MSLVAAVLLAALGIGGGLAAWRRPAAAHPPSPRAGVERQAVSTADASAPLADAVDEGSAAGAAPRFGDERVRRSAPAPSRREGGGGAIPRIALDPPTPVGVAVEIGGRDPFAPRALELWRIAGERTVLAARGASRADGTLAFAPFVLPTGELALVVAPSGEGAFAPGASEPVSASRDPASPRVEPLGELGGRLQIRVTPAERGGEILLAAPPAEGSEPAVLARAALAATPEGPAAPLELWVDPPPAEGSLRIAQRLPDGRLSPWRELPAPLPLHPQDDKETPDVPPLR